MAAVVLMVVAAWVRHGLDVSGQWRVLIRADRHFTMLRICGSGLGHFE